MISRHNSHSHYKLLTMWHANSLCVNISAKSYNESDKARKRL